MKCSILFLLMASTPAIAGTNAISENCQTQGRRYVIKGSWTESFPGARLWNLAKIRSAYKADSSPCLAEIFAQAQADSNEYWTKVASRKGCDLEKGTGCPDETLKNVQGNLAFVKLMSQVDKPIVSLVKPACCDAQKGPVTKSIS